MQPLTQLTPTNPLGPTGDRREQHLDTQSDISETLRMYYQYLREEEAYRKKEKTILLMVSLFVLFVGMTVASFGQETAEFLRSRNFSAEFGYGALPIPGYADREGLHKIAQRRGISEAVAMSFQAENEEQAHRELERVKALQQRDLELRKKVVELTITSFKLHQRLNNPTEIHADTPELAKQCEKLAQAIRQLMH